MSSPTTSLETPTNRSHLPIKASLLLCLTIFLSVGCAGKQRVAELESELASCTEKRTALEEENAQLQQENSKLQAQSKESAQLAEARKKLYQDLQDQLKGLIEAGTLEITIRNGLIVLQLPNKVLFASGKAAVKKEARQTLEQVAAVLKDTQGRRFFIAGHTDSQPLKADATTFKDNWDLSTARAYRVHQILMASGMTGTSLAIAGLADTDPVSTEETPDAMSENRRIEIMVMPDLSLVLPAIAQKDPADS